MTVDNGKYTSRWKDSLIESEATLKLALQAITKSGAFMACVVDAQNTLLGIVTDSDVRKALLNGASIDDKISAWVQRKPIAARDSLSSEELLDIAKYHDVREIPLVDAEGRISDIFVLLVHQERSQPSTDAAKTQSAKNRIANPMLLIAGGLGTRLRSVVSDKPKPLAIVGDRPVLETLIQKAAACGVNKFYVSVNYMADKIVEHLESSRYQGLDITILKEVGRLGTAGSLSLLPQELADPVIVCNADILTTVSFDLIARFHSSHTSDMTCVVHKHEAVVPYGVAQIEQGFIRGIVEKPTFSYMVNSGIYVLNPEICRMVPKNCYFDMTQLLDKVIASGKNVLAYMMHEYWRDIGKPDDYQRANAEYLLHFGEI